MRPMPMDGRTLPHDGLEILRFRAVRMYQNHYPVSEIAKAFGLHRGSVSRWLTQWRNEGAKALRGRKATGRPRKIDCQKDAQKIVRIVKRSAMTYGFPHPLWTCKRLQRVILKKLRQDLSIPTVWRQLKKLKLSCQKPERRALEQDPKARKKWIEREWPRIKRLAKQERALIFFQDESAIRLIPTVGRTWAPKGKTPIIRVTGRRATLLVMSALGFHGRLFFSIPNEKINRHVFIQFLKSLLIEYPKRKVFLILDQATPHIAKDTKKFAQGEKRLRLFYLPPYSPDFNPDEYVWDHLKSQELKAHQATNKPGLQKETIAALKRMARHPALLRSFFKRSIVT